MSFLNYMYSCTGYYVYMYVQLSSVIEYMSVMYMYDVYYVCSMYLYWG